MLSLRAAAIAVVTAFLAGLVATLAIRPPGAAPAHVRAAATDERGAAVGWRVPLAFQTTMPGLGDNPLYVARMLSDASDGRIQLQLFEPGEIIPAFSISDAVRDGKVAAGYTWLGYDQGKTPASALLAAVPFGMEPAEFIAWWFEAGGRALGEKLYARYHAHPIMCGLTGPETAGWFRHRIESLDDLQGLKIRFAGIGGKVMERLGASVTMLPGGEIFQALEKGAIDASEFSLPIVDQSLGFNRVAPYNYYPGWHQPASSAHLLVNLDVWNALAKPDQVLIEAVCTAGITRNLAKTEADQGAVIAGFPAIGVSAETLPLDLLRALEHATTEVLDEEAARDALFREILASQRAFRADYAHWKRRAYLPRDF
jgi:TRAP-type mannitol/chloroaromatic compound transport system substrate-binding protein